MVSSKKKKKKKKKKKLSLKIFLFLCVNLLCVVRTTTTTTTNVTRTHSVLKASAFARQSSLNFPAPTLGLSATLWALLDTIPSLSLLLFVFKETRWWEGRWLLLLLLLLNGFFFSYLFFLFSVHSRYVFHSLSIASWIRNEQAVIFLIKIRKKKEFSFFFFFFQSVIVIYVHRQVGRYIYICYCCESVEFVHLVLSCGARDPSLESRLLLSAAPHLPRLLWFWECSSQRLVRHLVQWCLTVLRTSVLRKQKNRVTRNPLFFHFCNGKKRKRKRKEKLEKLKEERRGVAGSASSFRIEGSIAVNGWRIDYPHGRKKKRKKARTAISYPMKNHFTFSFYVFFFSNKYFPERKNWTWYRV